MAFIYAGQGSQKVGMGKDMYLVYPEYRAVIDEAAPMYKELMQEGPIEELSKTQNTQPCMVAFAAGVTAVLFAHGIKPLMAAGLSLGEYSALHAASVFDAKTVVSLASFRGSQMEMAAQGVDHKMSAVLGADREVVQNVCKEASKLELGCVDIVNYNCPGQFVICGERLAVEKAEEFAMKEAAKRCICLNVSGPFHTKFMKPAGDALHRKFQNVPFQKLAFPIVFNATADFLRKEETIQELLVKQVQSSVYFEDSIRKFINEGIDTFVEIGPGKVLSGFVKKIDRDVTLYQIETAEELREFINLMEGQNS